MTRQQALNFLINRPADFAKMLGFTKLGSLHNQWIIDMVRGKGDKTLQASRGTYKTTCVSFALALIIILLPNKRTLFVRKTDGDVKEVIKQVQKILLDPHTQYFVQCIYGVNLILNVASATEVGTNLTTDIKGTNQLVGIGIGSSLTGKHFDFIFTDDIVNINDRTSKAERERTKIVYQELQNIKNRGGKIFNTGTPWSKEDAFSIMPEAERFDCYHPEIAKIISAAELEQIKSNMVPSLFAANYELRFIASENVIFTDPVTGGDPTMCEQGTMQVDSAFYGEDFTAWSVMKKVGDKYYLYGKMKRKHVEDCYAEIQADYERFMCGRCYNEDNADKGMVAKEFRKLGMKVITYHEDMNKYLKIVTYLKAIWKDVVFVEGTDKEYINQICDYFEDAEHDDACLDGDTLIATMTGNKKIKDIKAGEYIITPAGLRKAAFAGITGYKIVNKYFGVKATADHKFFDAEKGTFTRADSLASTARCDIISLKELIQWKRKLLSSTEKPISKIRRADIISSSQQKMQTEKTHNSYTEPFGFTTTEKSRKGIIYTTKMGILTITTLATWSVYRLGNICRNTARKICKILNTEKKTKNSFLKYRKKQKSGINLKQGESGTNNIAQSQYRKQTSTISSKYANFAEMNISEQQHKDFAPSVVKEKQDEEKKGSNCTMSTVCIVEKSLCKETQNTNIVAKSVNKNIIPVYNLTVEKAGCYYANGVLVSNCDSASSLARVLYKKREDSTYVPLWN